MTATAVQTTSVLPDRDAFQRDGFAIVRGLLSREEVNELLDNFDAMYKQQHIPGCFTAASEEEAQGDPLKRYPRMMHPHRVNAVSMRYMLHPKIAEGLRVLLGEEPLAAQSMFYWKPPGARGQALHQDNFYLKAKPGTCIAAWIALDPADRENGGLNVVPGSHKMEIVCPEAADTDVSFTTHLVRPPEGLREEPVDLGPGDCLFFGGNVIHGSYPNTSATRFRRAFICHYIPESAQEASHYYFPLHAMDGTVVERAASTDGGPCGIEAQGPH